MKPTPKQTWVGVAMLALTILSSYLGLDKAGYINQPPANTIETTNTFNVAAPTEHRHPALELRIKVLETWHGVK